MAGKKYGIDTDEFDRQTRDAFDEMLHTEEAKEWNYEELKRKYGNMIANVNFRLFSEVKRESFNYFRSETTLDN